ncbi:hypothetical protein C8F04DRAFT_1101526 [Mycena alexandri]|uniref:Uncharacterized protein n=1 Tax=Mycena alexandri TaxID=1745969 RepID=A0AAD6SXH2_9AGAR|nr:hypothetical protein C8F04DRAFT_1101526 [Mycena alexandri]
MNRESTSHIRLSETDREPETPQLHLSLGASSTLSTTLPFQIQITISRAADGHDRPCTFEWSPTIHGFSSSGFVLLHHTVDGGVKIVQVDHTTGTCWQPYTRLLKLPEEDDPLVVNGHSQFLWECGPGDKKTFVASLPERYHKILVPGEKYELLWPGREVSRWEWGAVRDLMNQELWTRSAEETRLVLPGGPSISLVAKAEPIPWPMRAEQEVKVGFTMANMAEHSWRLGQQKKQQDHQRRSLTPPIDASERTPGAPLLRVTLGCPPILTRGQNFDVTAKVTYDGVSDNSSLPARPIILHKYTLDCEGQQLYRRDANRNNWEKCDFPAGTTGFMIVDDPDVAVQVAKHEDFVSLAPGESWSTTHMLENQSWTELPSESATGDAFRFRFMGTTVDWWDWGSAEEHVDTVVKVPCFIKSNVVDPRDNDGRPRLVVPGSEFVEFRLV